MTSAVARERELARAHEHLSALVPESLLFVGPAGIGKSTVLAAAVDRAQSLGFEVRRSRAAASEQDLPYVGLHDLIGDALGEASASLAEPLRRALDVILLRAAPPDGGVDVLAVNVAVLEVLEAMADRYRMLLVLDDVQWLDRPTRRALGFAVRRLHPGRVVVAAATREAGRDVEKLIPEPSALIEIGPLAQAEIADLVELRTGAALSPQQAADLYRLSAGNPFLALELAHGRSAAVRGLERFPVPERQLQVLRPRLSALSPDGRRAVLVAALASRATTTLLADLAGAAGLADAASAGVLHVAGDSVEFGHPLFAAAARHEADTVDQRDIHLALASAADDPLERARHLALGTVSHDAGLAGELEAAAGMAADRAAITLAGELSRHALEHTPTDAAADRVRRAVAAGRWFHQCGEGDEARAVIAPVLQAMPPGPLRARCLLGLSVAVGPDIGRALGLLGEALEQPGVEPDVVLEARMERAGALFWSGDLEGARSEAAQAGAAARETGAAEVSAASAMVEALSDLCLGVPLEQSGASRWTEPWAPGIPAYDHPDRLLAYASRGRDDQHRARKLFEGLVRLA